MLEGKTVFLTGGGKGIGRAAAILMAENRANVFVCSRTESELDETVKLISDRGGKGTGYVLDVTNEAEVKKVFSDIGKKTGRLDVLVNNAAVFASGPMENFSMEKFRNILDVNCAGIFLSCREAFGLMKTYGGSIVNVSSLSGIRSVEKFPGFGPYVVSKFGVVGLTEALAVEWKDNGIRVNCIAPGAVDTEMLRKAAPNLYPRLGPEQVAKTILFLAGSDSSAINGSTVELFSHLQKE